MDETFMSRVAGHIAAATELVSSFSPAADPDNLAAVQTLDEWMASHSPGAKSRCAHCKAPLVESATKICLACGSLLPSDAAVRPEPFSFGKSLAKKLFFESVHLEDPHDTSSDDVELELQPTSSGTEVIANGDSQQQQPQSLGVETDESNVQGGESSLAIVSDSGDSSSIPPAEESSSSKPVNEEEDEEYIWGSADTDDFGLHAWTRQIGRDSGGDPKESTSAEHSAAISSANEIHGQTLSTSDDDFFTAVAISADQSLSQSVETDFNFFFPSGSSGDQPGGDQLGNTAAGPSVSKELPGPSSGTGFHDFFQAFHPTSGDQSLDPKAQTPDPFLRQASAGQNGGGNFDDFFQPVSKSTDRSDLANGGTALSFSGTSSSQNVEKDFDDFVQAVPKSADHSSGLSLEKPPPYTAEGTSLQKVETVFDDFLKAASGVGDHSDGLNLETPVLLTTEEFTGHDGEADFDDFLQAPAPRSAEQPGFSNPETAISHLEEDSSSQTKEVVFDFLSQQTSSESASEADAPRVEAEAAAHSPEKSSVQKVETDFDFFFQTVPVAGDQSRVQNIQTGASDVAEEAISPEVNYFDDFFQTGPKFGDEVKSQNGEDLIPVTVDERRTDFDVYQAVPELANHPHGLQALVNTTVEGSGRDLVADFDDFFQATSATTSSSRVSNTDGAKPNSAEGSGGENIETDFDSFFQAAPKSVTGLVEFNGGTGFDYFFQSPNKSEGELHGQYAQPGSLENLSKSNGQIEDPNFDEFFQGARISAKHSHGPTVKTVSPAEDSVDQNGGTGFADFFQGASDSVGDSNGHTTVTNFDFFKDAPRSVKETPGQNVATGFDAFFSTPSHSVDTTLGKKVTINFDHLFQSSPLSVESLEQNEAADFGNGDFEDFVQAAPLSANKAVSPNSTIEFDFFSQGTPGSVDVSQQNLTGFDDFFQATPKTSSIVGTRRQIDFLRASNQLADDSGANGRTTEVGANPISALTEGKSRNGSSNGDVLKQLEGLYISQSPSEVHSEPSRKVPKDLSDLSFRLADHLVISDDSPTSLWSFN